eukprot:gnl/TRDRNA2_/TRDRNA2_168560_c2_seq1.p1 gnl/TRDRNA2_/TRDRNA2_168560_c2~~gnl/TRDRNA2_/TRDRNA2_168560_c2_seq1.p1  ORF type:complete len:525 (+),score=69.61 gnl/TRDRNA2_/TRDRNA2_168560_c2_seq1:60-1634(+)
MPEGEARSFQKLPTEENGGSDVESVVESVATHGLEEDEYAEFAMDVDVYNVVLLSYLHREKEDEALKRFNMLIWPLFLAVVAVVVQFVMSWTVVVYVKTDMRTYLNMQPDRVLFNYAVLNKPLNGDQAGDMCGDYPVVEVKDPLPGANLTLPGGIGQMEGTKIFWSKLPAWRWDAQWLGADKSLLDTIRYVGSEKFVAFHQGYAILFMIAVLLWLCSIGIELRAITRMAFMLYGIPSHSEHEWPVTDEDGWHMNHLPSDAKAVGAVIVVTRLFLAVLVGYSGVYFLSLTNDLVDIILNSLALEFILMLDTVLAETVLSKPQIQFVEELQPVRYEAVLPNRIRTVLRYYFPLFGVGILCVITFFVRMRQVEVYSQRADNVAAICLFLGPSPKSDELVPSTGLCESIMKLTCVQNDTIMENPLYVGGSPCVITDFDLPWAIDIDEASPISVWPDTLYTKPAGVTNAWEWSMTKDPVGKKIQAGGLCQWLRRQWCAATISPHARCDDQGLLCHVPHGRGDDGCDEED